MGSDGHRSSELTDEVGAVKPYYSDSNVTIYHGDCRDIMPLIKEVNLLITDPPYGIDYSDHVPNWRHRKIIGDKELPIDLIKMAMAKATHASYVFCRWDTLHEMPRPKSVIAWIKNNWSKGDLKHSHGRKWEACCFYPHSEHQFLKRIPDVITAKRTGNNLHPTEKPIDAIQPIIESNVGEIIFDPFMGSGTTLVAARNLGRTAIGVELAERYCEVAAERCRQGILEL